MKNDYANSKAPFADGVEDRFLSKRLNFAIKARALRPALDVACHFETCAPMMIKACCLNKRRPQMYAVTWKKTVVTVGMQMLSAKGEILKGFAETNSRTIH